MSNGFLVCSVYLFLIIVEFLLKIVYCVYNNILFTIWTIFQQVLCANMNSTSNKKRKRNSIDQPNQTVLNRAAINPNWQIFLSSNLIMDKKTDKPAEKTNNDHYTGTFRRSRKKKSKQHETSNIVKNNTNNSTITHQNAIDSEIKADITGIDDINKKNGQKSVNNNDTKKNQLTKFIAMDCEMVGVGFDGSDHMLARVSLVNKFGDCIYDKFVKAREEVKDYRTDVSGIRREDMLNGEEFTTVQKEVAEILKGRILVGHSLKNDLSVLFLSHPKRNIRDTSRYKPFRKITKGSTPSLKRLAKEILGIDIQHGEHSSVEDAKAAMQLYCTVSKNWESMMNQKRGGRRGVSADE